MRIALFAILFVPQEKAELQPGLVGEYFAFGVDIDDFPSVKGKKPSLRRIDPTVDLREKDKKIGNTDFYQNLYVRWSGVIRVSKDGAYTFSTASDDGSRLWIDGTLIVDNGGVHGVEEKQKEIQLKAGDHELKMDYFNGAWGGGCCLSWETADQAKTTIPAEVFFHKKDADLDR